MLEMKTVLCPTDFSPVGDRGVNLAGHICQRFGSRLVVQYNLDFLPPLYLTGLETFPQSQAQFDDEQAVRADQLLKQSISTLPNSIKSDGIITRGLAPTSILNLARELPADMIVMGTHGRSGFGHMFVGSTTERVLVQSPCPVLAIRATEDHAPYLNFLDPDDPSVLQVVVPVDFSPHSIYTLEYAYRMADMLPVNLNLLHVIEPLSWDDMKGTTHFNVPEYQRLRMYEARQRLLTFIPPNMSDRTEAHVRIGSVVKEITSYADMIDARFILIGIRPKGIVDELFFGATSYGVLRSSKRPVWVVPGHRTVKSECAESTIETVAH